VSWQRSPSVSVALGVIYFHVTWESGGAWHINFLVMSAKNAFDDLYTLMDPITISMALRDTSLKT
jgi:hypothetical protein